ncbi:unnamed protein product [Bursaphelenchus xylophilus]|nr:unnamed protein product [Bursaphelenchus xylophilus]CAG9116378.1 unnamed protein product [Bursaphelenchus xylophilus]
MESDADVDMEELPGEHLPVLAEENDKEMDGGEEYCSVHGHKGDKITVTEAPEWPSYLVNVESDFGKSLSRRLFHWGPLAAIFLTGFIGITAVYVHLTWWPIDDPIAFLDLSLFTLLIYGTLYNLVRASYIGGGYVTKGWHPPQPEHSSRLQFCAHCSGYKAPRSHHCQKCNRCVMKMDHHCPWINNCVGHRNQIYFFSFLLFAVLGCLHACGILGVVLFRTLYFMFNGITRQDYIYNDSIIKDGTTFFCTVLAFSFSIGVVLAVGVLLYTQIMVVLRNKTGIEEYICTKAEYRERDESEGPFVFPYHLGIRRNISEVFPSFWARIPRGNGIWWPIRSDCSQFSLSEEQLIQKANKRFYARIYQIHEDFEGGWFKAWRFGLRTFICQPCSEERRIAVKKGESYAITRIQSNWLYGQRLLEMDKIEGPFSENPYAARASRDQTNQAVVKQATQPRGWFPKQVAKPKYRSQEDENKKDL